jgi:eIF-2B alpha/beta/delta-like uncharacterized protein
MRIEGKILEQIRVIKEDRSHGANWTAMEAVKVLRNFSTTSKEEDLPSFLQYLNKIATFLKEAKPSMASVKNSIDEVLSMIHDAAKREGSISSLKAAIPSLIDDFLSEFRKSTERIAGFAKDFVPYGATLLTHSFSDTIIEIMKSLKEKEIEVIVTESRPLNEGWRTAKEISEIGIPVTLITDFQAAHFIQYVSLVLVGADSILKDGSLVNKTGTKILALLAKEQGIPFYVVCSTYKFMRDGEVKLEEKSWEEVIENPPRGIKVRNVYFDITHPNLLSGVITEKGFVDVKTLTLN